MRCHILLGVVVAVVVVDVSFLTVVAVEAVVAAVKLRRRSIRNDDALVFAVDAYSAEDTVSVPQRDTGIRAFMSILLAALAFAVQRSIEQWYHQERDVSEADISKRNTTLAIDHTLQFQEPSVLFTKLYTSTGNINNSGRIFDFGGVRHSAFSICIVFKNRKCLIYVHDNKIDIRGWEIGVMRPKRISACKRAYTEDVLLFRVIMQNRHFPAFYSL
jgi:hypothetical protein